MLLPFGAVLGQAAHAWVTRSGLPGVSWVHALVVLLAAAAVAGSVIADRVLDGHACYEPGAVLDSWVRRRAGAATTGHRPGAGPASRRRRAGPRSST